MENVQLTVEEETIIAKTIKKLNRQNTHADKIIAHIEAMGYKVGKAFCNSKTKTGVPQIHSSNIVDGKLIQHKSIPIHPYVFNGQSFNTKLAVSYTLEV